jgi:phosphatidylglycerol:prolipoprotein diacylglycerol transferase
MFYWDPPLEVFRLPYLDHPIAWYGLFFVTGFIAGYYLIKHLFTQLSFSKQQSHILADKLVWFTVIGTLIGARLGHILFYDLGYYLNNPHLILKTWEGGLASHGGAIGVLTALVLYRRSIAAMAPQLTFLRILDLIVIPTAFAGVCIRFGNFWNQELVGMPTTMPWGVIFLPAVRPILYPGFWQPHRSGILQGTRNGCGALSLWAHDRTMA